MPLVSGLPLLGGLALVLLWLALVLTAAGLARRLWPGQRELSRKLVHMGAGLALPIAWATAIPLAIALPAALGATLITALNHRYRLLPAVEDVGRHSWGTIAYGASISLLLALYWPSRPELVTAGVLTMALGDGLAGLGGAALPSFRWKLFGQTKSLWGTALMASVSAGVLLMLLPGAPWGLLLAIAATATALEQLSWGGLDNLTVPLATAWLCSWLRA